MKIWTVLIALYGDVESRLLFPSEAECSAALQPMQAILEASYDDVAALRAVNAPERVTAPCGEAGGLGQ